jgi:ribosomal protein L37AE/L43A
MLNLDKSGLFPRNFVKTQDSQMKECGVVYTSKSTVNDRPICVECEKAGRASFTCHMCKTQHPSDALQESFGIFPTDHLCKKCYHTVTAAAWETEVEQLREEHRYDFE